MPNKFTLVSTSRESPEYIAPVCDCLWHHHRLPGSLVPNELRPDLTSRESLELLIRITKKDYAMYKTRYREALFELDINLVDIEKKAIT